MTLSVNASNPEIPPKGHKGSLSKASDAELIHIFGSHAPTHVKNAASSELNSRARARIEDANAAQEAKYSELDRAEKEARYAKADYLRNQGFDVYDGGIVALDTPQRQLRAQIETSSQYDNITGASATAIPVINSEKFDIRTDADKQLNAVTHPDLGSPVGKAKKDENGAKVQNYDSGAQVSVSKNKYGTTTITTYPDGSSETVTVLTKKGTMNEYINNEQFRIAPGSTVVVQKDASGKEIYKAVNAE